MSLETSRKTGNGQRTEPEVAFDPVLLVHPVDDVVHERLGLARVALRLTREVLCIM